MPRAAQHVEAADAVAQQKSRLLRGVPALVEQLGERGRLEGRELEDDPVIALEDGGPLLEAEPLVRSAAGLLLDEREEAEGERSCDSLASKLSDSHASDVSSS